MIFGLLYIEAGITAKIPLFHSPKFLASHSQFFYNGIISLRNRTDWHVGYSGTIW
jgi:hypothetical protein